MGDSFLSLHDDAPLVQRLPFDELPPCAFVHLVLRGGSHGFNSRSNGTAILLQHVRGLRRPCRRPAPRHRSPFPCERALQPRGRNGGSGDVLPGALASRRKPRARCLHTPPRPPTVVKHLRRWVQPCRLGAAFRNRALDALNGKLLPLPRCRLLVSRNGHLIRWVDRLRVDVVHRAPATLFVAYGAGSRETGRRRGRGILAMVDGTGRR